MNRRTKRGWAVIAAAAVTVLVLAVAGLWLIQGLFVDQDQPRRQEGLAAPLGRDLSVGQTFVARHAGLTAMEVWLLPQSSSPLTVTLHVRADPRGNADLAAGTLQLAVGALPGYYRFSFPRVNASHGQSYYAFLVASADGVSVAMAPGNVYLDGAAYRDDQPLDAQVTFRLVYDQGALIGELLRAALGALGLIACALLLWIMPGYALLTWCWPSRHISWAETLGISCGIGLAIYPVLLLWASLVGLRLGSWSVWLIVGGASALLAIRAWRSLRLQSRRAGRKELASLVGPHLAWLRRKSEWPDLALVASLVLVFGVRLLVARGIDAPLFGDGYQHTMIAQLIVDHGGLFRSWAPYADLNSFTYHFGFHTAVSAFHWLTALPVVTSTIWTGQLLNALAVLALYPLAVRVTGSRWGGVWAVTLAGLLSPMPMVYVNWGRYTQLAGLAILPAVMVLTWDAAEGSPRRWPLLVLAALSAAGLALTHYRVLIFYMAFVVALALLSGRRTGWKETALRLGSIGFLGALLFLPWFINSFTGNTPQFYGEQLTTPPDQANPFMQTYNAVGSLATYLGPLGWLASLLGLGLGLWQRHRGVLLVGLWGLILLLVANPAWLSLPGTGVVNNFTVLISIYLLAGPLSGVLFGFVADNVESRRWASPLLAVALVVLGLSGLRARLHDLDLAGHALVTRPDVQAAAWIRENTPADARFLINSFLAYGGGTAVGSDAGWWLPLLAGRANTVPPLSYASELPSDSDAFRQVVDLARIVGERGPTDPQVLQMLRQEGITQVYIGQQQGRVNYAGPAVLDPQALSGSPDYRMVYHQDRVWVFALEP